MVEKLLYATDDEEAKRVIAEAQATLPAELTASAANNMAN